MRLAAHAAPAPVSGAHAAPARPLTRANLPPASVHTLLRLAAPAASYAVICMICAAILVRNSLTQNITLDIIFYRNIVIFKRWHYTEAYKTDKNILEYESNRVCRAA